MTEWQWEPLDWQLADFAAGFEQDHATLLRRSVRLLSHQMRAGDTCLNLADFAGQTMDDEALPDAAAWAEALGGCQSVGESGKPLVLDADSSEPRLYFQRYWHYENTLASGLLALASGCPSAPTEAWLDRQLDDLPLAALQKQAVTQAFQNGLCVISGGPGTGKTTTVSALVMLLKRWDPALRIALAAPTGKAAARMQQAVHGAAEFLGLPADEAAALSHQASTLHRLLGYRRNRVCFRHHRENPLSADVVIVDEASMIDLALMSKLVDAVRPGARLVLLGDKDQLASVEAGAVMSTLCSQEPSNPLRDNVVALEQVHRFERGSGINQLAQAVNAGDSEQATEILLSGRHDDVQLLDASSDAWRGVLQKRVLRRMDAGNLASLHDFQLLCALRNGPRGVTGMNRQVEQFLGGKGRIPPRSDWYAGRPVMITRNSPSLKLYNGDIGLTVRHNGALRVRFPGMESGAGFSSARLPQHETSWALTVHKSQGSEFDEVMLVLPDEMSPLLTRELIYTAITRARSRLTVVGTPELVRHAMEQTIERRSGLEDRLRRFTSTPAP